jgi:hypothetical protein
MTRTTLRRQTAWYTRDLERAHHTAEPVTVYTAVVSSTGSTSCSADASIETSTS